MLSDSVESDDESFKEAVQKNAESTWKLGRVDLDLYRAPTYTPKMELVSLCGNWAGPFVGGVSGHSSAMDALVAALSVSL
jgi:hypothetical protein